MIIWDPVTKPSIHMYRCAYCRVITTTNQRSVGRRIRGSLLKVQSVTAYQCGDCGNTTCFDGDRQIPAPSLYPECHPLPRYVPIASSDGHRDGPRDR